MKACSQVPGFQKNPQDSKLEAGAGCAEGCSAKAALSNDELELVSAAGDAHIPTVNVDVLLGRHAIPDNEEKRRL